MGLGIISKMLWTSRERLRIDIEQFQISGVPARAFIPLAIAAAAEERSAKQGKDACMVSPAILARKLNLLREQGQQIVFTNGCFDGLHAGHRRCLQEARLQGDILVVAINSDDSIRRLAKGPGRPINPAAWRAAALLALPFVEFVTVFDDDTPLTLLELFRPHVLVKGGDYTPEQVVGRELIESYGGRVHVSRLVPGVSTTLLIEQQALPRAA